MDSYRNLNFTYEKINDLLSDVDSSKGDSSSLTARLDAIDTAMSNKASISDITSAINDLDAESVGGSGKYISAISETGGVISATASQIDSVPTENSTNPVTSGGVYTPISANRAALVELVDGGAKNLSTWYTGTAATDGTTIATAVPIKQQSGDFVFSYSTSLTTGSITIGFRDENNTLVGSVQVDNITKVKTATIPSDAVRFNVYASKAGTYSNFMICSKAAWDISHAFQPYRPSYQELCDRVN